MTLPLMFATLMLTDEIEERINIQLNTIINGWDLSLIEVGISLDKVDVSEFEYSQIEKYKTMWEDIAKLSINLMVDYEYYRQFCFESRYSMKEYSVRLLNFGFVFENDLWKSVSKPDIKDARINIFMYFLYRLIFEKMAFNRDNDQNGENEKRHLKLIGYEETKNDELEASGGILFSPDLVDRKIIVDHCSFCDNEILSTESKCSVCDSTIVEHLNMKEKNTNLNIIVKSKCGQCGGFNESSDIICGACSRLCADETWTCGRCKTENRDTDIGCQECRYMRSVSSDNGGSLMVNEGDLREVNDGDNMGNSGGDERNANITVIEGDNKTANIGVRNYENEIVVDGSGGDIPGIVDRDKQTLIPVDKWRCTKCMVIQSYKNTSCEVCGSSRRVLGEWGCVKCEVINKYDNEKCHICGEWNDNFPKKLCQYCKTNRVIRTEVRCGECARNMNIPWKCGYSKCGSMNKGIDEYCYECRFWRHNTYGRGDECKQQGRYIGWINKGWICHKCDRFIDLDKSHCYKYDCKASRYATISEVANMGERRDTKTGVEKGTGASYKVALVAGGSGGGIPGIVDTDKQTHIPMDEWRCTYTDCNTRQSYKHIVCQICDHSRLVYGVWMCAKCEVINKCDNEKCLQCGEWNDYLPKKFCQYCKTNRVTGTEVRCGECARKGNNQWKCGYIRCGSINIVNDEYCVKCKFWRYNTYGRGEECRRQYGYGGWICGKCETHNELSISHCTRMNCTGTRYAKILCDRCHSYNDHKSTRCWKCQYQLR